MWFLKLSVALVGVHQVSASIKASAKDALIQGSASRTLAGFQKFTDNLVNAYLEKGETIREQDPECSIIEEYIKALHDESLLEHQGDLTVGSHCTTQYNSCDEHFTGHNGQLDILLAEVTGSRNNHSECRDVQAGACEKSENSPGFNDGTPKEENQCSLYTDYRQDTNQAKLPDCAEPGNFALSDDFITAEEGTPDGLLELHKMEACLVQMKNWLDIGDLQGKTSNRRRPGPPGLYPRMTECTTNMGCCEDPAECMDPVGVDGECCDKQHKFEIHHCSYETMRQARCSLLTECWEEKKGECNTNCDALAKRVLGRQTDNETMERISCLLRVLKADSADKVDKLNACKSASGDFGDSLVAKRAFWDIADCPPVYEVKEIHSHCEAPIMQTCNEEFEQQEYANRWNHLVCTCDDWCAALD